MLQLFLSYVLGDLVAAISLSLWLDAIQVNCCKGNFVICIEIPNGIVGSLLPVSQLCKRPGQKFCEGLCPQNLDLYLL